MLWRSWLSLHYFLKGGKNVLATNGIILVRVMGCLYVCLVVWLAKTGQ